MSSTELEQSTGTPGAEPRALSRQLGEMRLDVDPVHTTPQATTIADEIAAEEKDGVGMFCREGHRSFEMLLRHLITKRQLRCKKCADAIHAPQNIIGLLHQVDRFKALDYAAKASLLQASAGSLEKLLLKYPDIVPDIDKTRLDDHAYVKKDVKEFMRQAAFVMELRCPILASALAENTSMAFLTGLWRSKDNVDESKRAFARLPKLLAIADHSTNSYFTEASRGSAPSDESVVV